MLKKLSLRTPRGRYSAESTWSIVDDMKLPEQARILSVIRYGGDICQFGDVVEWETMDLKGLDGIVVKVVQPARYSLHVLSGPPISPGQAMALTEKMRERELQIEAWSITMNLPGQKIDPNADQPLAAGLVLKPDFDPLEALLRLRVSAQEIGIMVACPSLSRQAHDEVGALRDQRLAGKWAA
jgi:hypothetical protein